MRAFVISVSTCGFLIYKIIILLLLQTELFKKIEISLDEFILNKMIFKVSRVTSNKENAMTFWSSVLVFF